MCSPEAEDAAGEDADGEWCGVGVHERVSAEDKKRKPPGGGLVSLGLGGVSEVGSVIAADVEADAGALHRAGFVVACDDADFGAERVGHGCGAGVDGAEVGVVVRILEGLTERLAVLVERHALTSPLEDVCSLVEVASDFLGVDCRLDGGGFHGGGFHGGCGGVDGVGGVSHGLNHCLGQQNKAPGEGALLVRGGRPLGG